MPKVSIILTSFNHAKYLREAIDSALNQIFTDFELIIWDDASSDNSWEIIQSYQDPRIKAFRNDMQRRGVYGINKAISEVVQGEYIAIHHSDDVWELDKLEKQVAFLDDNHQVGAVFTWVQIIDDYGNDRDFDWFSRKYDRWRLLRELFCGENHLNHPSVLVRKSCYYDVGLYKYGLAQTADAEMWSRLLLKYEAVILEEPLVRHRLFLDGSNTSGSANNSAIRTQNEWNILRGNFLRCHNYEEFIRIFPETSQIADKETFSVIHALAFVSLNPSLPSSAWGFGMDLLYQEIANGNKSEILSNDYDYRNLIKESGLFDVFGVSHAAALAERDGKIAIAHEQIVSLKQAIEEQGEQIASLSQVVTERDSQITALYSSTSWRLTRPLRFIMHLIRATQTFKKAISYYGSPIVVLKKVVRIFRNEGVPGVLSRANVLSEVMRTSVSHDVGNMMEGLRWPIPPADNDFLPKVSVVVPNYNHAPYLKRRLDSIYGQTYRNFEVILLDDCSTDESQNILCEYANRYKEITTVVFNSINSGGVFNQWHKGISLAHGDLIWIAESDDYCDVTHLSELVRFFKNEAVMLSFCRSDFVKGDDGTKMWTSEEFLADTKLDIWGNEFIRSAHWVVNHAWGMKNIIPNVSSAIFRHPGAIPIMSDKSWRNMRLCGDWIFYLHLIRGGLVAYSPRTTNYYRQHGSGTSINIQKENTYYREHEKVAVELLELYKIDPSILDRQQQSLYLHWCVSHGSNRKQEFEALYNLTRVRSVAKPRTPNILMAGFALIAGGGETFPIMMANLLRKRGAGVSFLNCRNAQTDLGVRRMLNRSVPLFELDGLHRIGALCYDLGIEIIHSHHAWVDMTLAQCLMHEPKIKQVITMHGMYEMMPRDAINNIISLMEKRISRIIFTAEKNLAPFSKEFQEGKKFTRINNALEIEEIYPVERSTLGIGEDDFVLCLVSRAIPEKGWMEAIQAVELARLHCPRKICLLLIGEGEEFDRLKHKCASELTRFLGFRSNIRDYFAMADMGILPSRFKGESYPLVLIDCLLAGKPMIASRIGEIHEMLSADDSLAGELFELQNFSIPIENLANLIVRLASDSTYYQILKGRVPSAVKKFDPSIMMEKYEDIYRSVLIAE